MALRDEGAATAIAQCITISVYSDMFACLFSGTILVIIQRDGPASVQPRDGRCDLAATRAGHEESLAPTPGLTKPCPNTLFEASHVPFGPHRAPLPSRRHQGLWERACPFGKPWTDCGPSAPRGLAHTRATRLRNIFSRHIFFM